MCENASTSKKYSNRKSGQKDLVIQMGRNEVATWNDFVFNFKDHNKLCICPHCFTNVHLSRRSEKLNWAIPKEGRLGVFHKLSKKYRNEDKFLDHCDSCEPILEPGINRIDSNSPKRLWDLVEMFSVFVKNDGCRARWSDARRIYRNDFLKGNLIAYAYNSDIGPLSFVIFKELKYRSLGGSLPIQWDAYTFPQYRNMGYASELIDHAIDDLGLTRTEFPVYGGVPEALGAVLDNIGVKRAMVI